MSIGRFSARLDRLARDLREGLAAGLCAVCSGWGWVRDYGTRGDPWTMGACPVCGRRPDLVCVGDERDATAAERDYTGHPVSLIVGVRAADL